jgi:hypothetical protein
MTSENGYNWTSRSPGGVVEWKSVTSGDGQNGSQRFVAVGQNNVLTSVNGTAWTVLPLMYGSLTAVAYGGPLGAKLFVAVPSIAVITSFDGIAWTYKSAAAAHDWSSVTWGSWDLVSGSGLFIAVGQTGARNGVMTSPDGITWSLQISAISTWLSVAWGGQPGAQRFVAVGRSGVMTSP